MITLPDTTDSQQGGFLNQPYEDPFTPDAHFGEWLEAIESFRNREVERSLPGAFVDKGDLDFEDALKFYDYFEKKISSEGTLVVTEQGQLEADVEVTLAIIDGLFKGNIIATEGVVLQNHALVIGDIYTPELTIRGGAIIEGRIHFDMRPQTSWERPRWEAFKVGFARVWRSRIFS